MTVATGNFAVGIDIDPRDTVAGDALTARVVAAENAGFTFATFDDSPLYEGFSRVDAITRAAFVAATTSTIGLVPLAGTTYSEPFHISSQLASLDYASRGRGGWICHAWSPSRVALPLWRLGAFSTTDPAVWRQTRPVVR